MINKPASAEIKDQNEINDVGLDINFDEKYPESVRIAIGDNVSIVKYSDLFSFMFVLATKEQQSLMMPVKQELGHQYMKEIQVKLTKDLKKGEFMVVQVPINVPNIVAQEIKEKELSLPE